MTVISGGVYRARDFAMPIKAEAVRLLLLTDGYPPDFAQHYVHSDPRAMPWQNTRQVFATAGIEVGSFEDLVARGILLATCLDEVAPAKTTAGDVTRAAARLEPLLAALLNLRAIGLMGDLAIAAFTRVHKARTGTRLIPAASTYKIRGEDFFWGDIQVLPSYLHTGKSFLIERSKQRMVADDLVRMLRRL